MDPKRPDDALTWARARLGLASEAAAARGALLRQLEAMDFAPAADWDDARRLADQTERGGVLDQLALAAARRAADDAVRAEVETFAARLFSLSPAARTAQYQHLLKRCVRSPAALNRLEALRAAFMLPCDLPCDQPTEVLELLHDLLRLFVLPQPERARRRMALLTSRRGDRRRWRRPARLIQTKFSRYAALEPALLNELAAPENRAQLREKIVRRRRRAAQPPSWTTILVREVRQLSVSVWFAILLFGFGLIANLFKDPNKPSPPPPAPRFDARKANEELSESVNKALREGQPVGEALRRLNGLPPAEKRPPTPKTSPEPSQPPRFGGRDAQAETVNRAPPESRPIGASPHRVFVVPPERESR